MIERILWPHHDEKESPFQPDATRPLQLTFHDASFDGLPPGEQEALKALKSLAWLKSLSAVGSSPGEFPCMEIKSPVHDGMNVDVFLKDSSGEHHTAFPRFSDSKDLARELSRPQDEQSSENQRALRDVLVARAHAALGRDILVTHSGALLANRGKLWIRDANPRSPLEAAKIVGLFLRARRDYALHAGPRYQRAFDRGLFYWVLTRSRLPSMWSYFSACLDAGKLRNDDSGGVGQSILIRCSRAHEARDAILRLLYVPHDNNIRDEMMYHFEYLMLLLSGALDAQARIAHRAFKIEAPKERFSQFHKKDFRKALRDAGASELHAFLTSTRFSSLTSLLNDLRNTIHGASMPTLAYHEGAEPQKSYIDVIPEHRDKLWEAAEAMGSAGQWGLRRSHGSVLLEPCTYSVKLVEESLKCINEIAGATDLVGLFPAGHVMGKYSAPPADDEIFGDAIRARVEALG